MTPEQRLSYLKHGWKDEVELIESLRHRAEGAYSSSYAAGLKEGAMGLEALLVSKLVARNQYET